MHTRETRTNARSITTNCSETVSRIVHIWGCPTNPKTVRKRTKQPRGHLDIGEDVYCVSLDISIACWLVHISSAARPMQKSPNANGLVRGL